MAQINVNQLTFSYEGSFDNVFEDVSFSIDTDWKLGFIGRNGKGKTTFLNLLMGKYPYTGSISRLAGFDYFPYEITPAQEKRFAAEFLEELKQQCELWRVICELEQLNESAEILYRPFETLSPGERTKILLAVLFSGENDFLLIDEPTNHLDQESRETVKTYLAAKKGFLVVSHDRELLDDCVDHVLVLNRKTIEVQKGNFSSWWENKQRRDQFARAENEKHLKEIGKLKQASARAARWADKNEAKKIGYDPIKEHDRGNGTRPYIGAKTKKMQSRVKQMQNRIRQETEEKEGLLVDLEEVKELKLTPLSHHKETLLRLRDYGIQYQGAPNAVFTDLTFTLNQGERIALHGKNGCGKSTLLKMILQKSGCGKLLVPESGGRRAAAREEESGGRRAAAREEESGGRRAAAWEEESGGRDGSFLPVLESGTCETASGLVISYVNQNTSMLRGSISEFCRIQGLDQSIFCGILRRLDVGQNQFSKNMEDFSEGQKKKILIAASLLTPAHLYVWDEPLNYMDVFSRMQVEELLLHYRPTMLFVEHDRWFREKIATAVISL